MNAVVPGTFHDGRVVLEAPVDWPEGMKVQVIPVESGERIGLTEEEWSDSPEAIEDWLRWYRALEPLKITPEEEAEFWRFQEEIDRYTKEAVRRQMEEGLK